MSDSIAIERRVARLTLSYDALVKLLGDNVPEDARVILIQQQPYDVIRRRFDIFIESSEFPITWEGVPIPIPWEGQE